MKYKTDIAKHVLQVGADVNGQKIVVEIHCIYGVTNWNSIEVIWLSLENRLEH